MTEGIIREVISKYILNTDLQYQSKNVAYQIEQELIAEIKNEFNEVYNLDMWAIGECKPRILKLLIGDTS
jgi:hypothetical protein